jgi:quercetin dioxygenase-like cupin family protein
LYLRDFDSTIMITILVSYMTESTACHSLKLPFTFNVPYLLKDMNTCMQEEWKLHFNTADYSGNWTSIALYSVSGEANDIQTYGGAFQPTSLLKSCSYFSAVLKQFECTKEAVRLLHLAPGSVIHEHRDRGLAYEYGSFRLHIPVHTNGEVDFIVGGCKMEMQAGECWYANFDLTHSVRNCSTEGRIHLVIDCLRNEWSDKLFAECGYDFELERRVLEPDLRTALAMIAELARMNTDTARAMITELKGKLNA